MDNTAYLQELSQSPLTSPAVASYPEQQPPVSISLIVSQLVEKQG